MKNSTTTSGHGYFIRSHLFFYDRNTRVVKTIIYLSDEVQNLDVWYYNANADCSNEMNMVNVPIITDKNV